MDSLVRTRDSTGQALGRPYGPTMVALDRHWTGTRGPTTGALGGLHYDAQNR